MNFKSLSHCLALALAAAGCAVAPAAGADTPIAIDGESTVLDGQRYLQYRVGTKIYASPEVIWALLTDAPSYPSWNSTITSIEGEIAKGEQIKLKAKIDPKRTFKLEVTSFEPHTRLVWGDGGRAFSGVREFQLVANEDGSTDFTMVETLQGSMMGMIEGSLPDFRPDFKTFAADLKRAAEAQSN